MSDIYMHPLIELLHKSKYTCTGVQLIYCRNYVVSVSNLHSFSSLVLDHFRLTCDRRTQQQASKLAFQTVQPPASVSAPLFAIFTLFHFRVRIRCGAPSPPPPHLISFHSDRGRRMLFLIRLPGCAGVTLKSSISFELTRLRAPSERRQPSGGSDFYPFQTNGLRCSGSRYNQLL